MFWISMINPLFIKPFHILKKENVQIKDVNPGSGGGNCLCSAIMSSTY